LSYTKSLADFYLQFYNLVFFPSFASSELLDQLDASLDNVQHAVDFLYSERECGFEARDINDKLTSDMDRSAVLLQQASWEIAHQAGEWEEHRAVVETLDKLRVILFTSVLDRCAYRMLKPDTARILRQPVADCHKGELSSPPTVQPTKSVSDGTLCLISRF
jgi:hypothetical protein